MTTADGDLSAATVRDLILELAQVEDAVRLAASQGAIAREIELAEHEQEIVAELHTRDVMVSLGSGAEAALAASNADPAQEPKAAPIADVQRTIAGLKEAVVSRTVIGRATGILMERHRLDAVEAFERLRVTSQQRNLKVRDVAAELVATGLEEDRGVDRRLADRAVVARAQGILMERHHVTEKAALDWLRTAARRTGRSLPGVAEHLVTTGTDLAADFPSPGDEVAMPRAGQGQVAAATET